MSAPASTPKATPAPGEATGGFAALAQTHARVCEAFFTAYATRLETFAQVVAQAMSQGKRLFLCGNGGSACDAMHIAGEFVGRFERERRALPALALSADSGILTALGNDYGFSRLFARQLEALAQPEDVLIALSTSGKSANIAEALAQAEKQQLTRALFTGEAGQDKAQALEHGYVIPSRNTARIQECTMVALHGLAGAVEAALAPSATHSAAALTPQETASGGAGT